MLEKITLEGIIIGIGILPNTQLGLWSSSSLWNYRCNLTVVGIKFCCFCTFLNVSRVFTEFGIKDYCSYSKRFFSSHFPSRLSITRPTDVSKCSVPLRLQKSPKSTRVSQKGVSCLLYFSIILLSRVSTMHQIPVADYTDDKVVLSISKNCLTTSSEVQLQLN